MTGSAGGEKALVAGVDEAGRGPLAGPVVAAAVVLDPRRPVRGLADSKVLSAAARERLSAVIRARARMFAIASASVDEIDQLNILNATLLAMQRAVAALALYPGRALVDGNRAPALDCEVCCVVGGDARVPEISAASILAKVERDREMVALDRRYPLYGFASNKGYPTRAHRHALARHGPCPAHRYSFGPVRRLVEAPSGEWDASTRTAFDPVCPQYPSTLRKPRAPG